MQFLTKKLKSIMIQYQKFLIGICCFLLLVTLSPMQIWAQKIERSLLYLEVFSQVFSYIESDYFEAKDQEKLIDAAIHGMLSELDTFSHYYQRSEYDRLINKATGKNGGLGFEIKERNHNYYIDAVKENSSAAHAGLKIGDLLIKVNNKKIQLLTPQELQTILEGPVNTKVRLRIKRRSWSHSKNITLLRRELQNKDIIVEIDQKNSVIYVQLKYFSENIAQKLLKSVQSAKKKLRNIKGIIIDLRGNPGGVFEESISIADFFLSKGPIIHLQSKEKSMQKTYKAHKQTAFKKDKLIILIDEQSASSSEILAAALKDRERALLIGKTSFGKASIQSVYHLKNGAGLKLTVAHYLSPKHKDIHGIGIQADLTPQQNNQSKNDQKIDIYMETAYKALHAKKSIQQIIRCQKQDFSKHPCF